MTEILALNELRRQSIAEAASQTVARLFSFDRILAQKMNFIQEHLGREPVSSGLFPFIQKIFAGKTTTSGAGIAGRLSIVIPFYNLGQYIDETIESLVQSDYPDKEILIINDGSTDESSIRTLDKYRRPGTVIVVDTPNRGLANARNFGASQATGEFLAFLDADDRVTRDYYQRAIAVLSNYENVQFVGSWTRYFGDSTAIWPCFSPEPPLIFYHNLVNSSALVYKRAGFMKWGLNDAGMPFTGWEDYDSVISLIESGAGGVVLPEPMFEYRVRRASMVRALSREKKINLSQYIVEKHAVFYANFAGNIQNLQTANGPGFYLDNPSIDFNLLDKTPFGGLLAGKLLQLIKKNRHARQVAYKLYKYFKK